MAFTRALLKGLGLTDEQQTAVIEAHQSEMDTVKDERDRYKSDAEAKGKSLDNAQKQLGELKQANTDADGWKAKYEASEKAFGDYKAQQEAAAANAAKRAALDALLKDAFTPDGAEIIRKHTDLSGVELTKDGAIKGAEKFLEGLKTDWKPFVKTTTTTGANIPNPPTSAAPSASFKSLEDAMRAKNENPALEIDYAQFFPPDKN